MLSVRTVGIFLFTSSFMLAIGSDLSAQGNPFPTYSPSEPITPKEKKTSAFPSFSNSADDPSVPSAFPPPGGESAFPPIRGSKAIRSANRSLSFNELGELLTQMKLEPSQIQSRYDFFYQTEVDEQEIELSFSTMIRKEESLVRVRAWLDPLPAGAIPGEPLLKMLSRNEEMNHGIRFAYSKQTGRFLLEKSISGQNLTPEKMTKVLHELSLSVTDNWSTWSTSEWKNNPKRAIDSSVAPEIISDDRFEMPVRR